MHTSEKTFPFPPLESLPLLYALNSNPNSFISLLPFELCINLDEFFNYNADTRIFYKKNKQMCYKKHNGRCYINNCKFKYLHSQSLNTHLLETNNHQKSTK